MGKTVAAGICIDLVKAEEKKEKKEKKK